MFSDNSLDTIMSQTSWEFDRMDGEILLLYKAYFLRIMKYQAFLTFLWVVKHKNFFTEKHKKLDRIDGNTDQLVIACDFIVDFTDFMIYMQDFRVVTLGSININLRGNPLVDWLSNLIITTVGWARFQLVLFSFCFS